MFGQLNYYSDRAPKTEAFTKSCSRRKLFWKIFKNFTGKKPLMKLFLSSVATCDFLRRTPKQMFSYSFCSPVEHFWITFSEKIAIKRKKNLNQKGHCSLPVHDNFVKIKKNWRHRTEFPHWHQASFKTYVLAEAIRK